MKTTKRSLTIPIAMCFVGIALNVLQAEAVAAPDEYRPGVLTSHSVYEAAVHEAKAGFWLTVAAGLNDPDVDLPELLLEAWNELQEELELAQEQLEARLDLLEDLGYGPYDPDIEPDDFATTVNSRYLPLIPLRTLIYEKQTPEGLERVEVTTLAETVEIDGFECLVVNDVEYLEDEVVEDTVDWMAQNMETGDIWYFGEIAKNYEDGLLDNLDGSWRTGKDDAKPGILMFGSPVPGTVYRQEYFINEAEDIGMVVSLDATVTVPYGTFTHCLETEDWTPLEPEAVERKYYAQGIGLVLEVDLETGERLELVQIIE